MIWKVGMPNLGHTMDEGKVAEWLVSEGASVRQGAVIGTVETDKATFDIESPADGVVLAIHVPAGRMAAVGDAIATVGPAGAFIDQPMQAPEAPGAAQAPAVTTNAATPVAEPAPTRPRASPAARALAENLGLDLNRIVGTGEDGLVTREDVRAAATSAASTAPEPLSPMRRAIAAATSAAWQTIPHVALTAPADLTRFEARGASGLTAAIVRAAALALRDHPGLNGWLTEGGFQPAARADIAVAIATPDGLVTATIPAADAKPEPAIAAEIARRAAEARNGTLDGRHMTGASFTVSSLGRWGVQSFAPIISAPQVAILGVGRVERVAREIPGGFRFVSQVALTLVFDHRATDGVAAARALAAIIERLENPEPLEATP